MTCTIERIYRYPIKSGSSALLTHTTITKAGIVGDRQWALVSPNHTLLPDGQWMSCGTFERRKIQTPILIKLSNKKTFISIQP